MPHLGQAAAWAGVDASQQEMSGGHMSLRELLLTAGMARAGSARGARAMPVAKAFFGRQTAEQMLTEGVDLEAHEGADLGHTLLKHVNVTDADLMRRIETEGRHETSRFIDRVRAEGAITDALRRDAASVQSFQLGHATQLRVRVTLDENVGWVMSQDGSITATSQLVVWLRKDAEGIYISSSYPELPR